ncbi:GntR family transcriptional regulator [Anaerostipes sp.]|uniref:GntR family transcriptional regulator n=1 Tax=Anaerostipes sp. TaxID=1872530 RepID=UPI0025B88666|nr:GntR family transcriptional regulator [Anaerostipes sp.]MBS7008086.1 GntR family transcriptional regulator [Anaerostipes sp.]
MSNYHSQEQTIYRNLSGKIQMGFYDDEKRFPSAKQIARQFQVSYCPAQRALKMLESDGLIKLCRGSATTVLNKPYDNYLESDIFKRRRRSLLDLCQSLELISPALCLYIIQHAGKTFSSPRYQKVFMGRHAGRDLYQQFEQTLLQFGNQTVLSLYYDISSFSGSAFLDILYLKYGKEKADSLLKKITLEYTDYLQTKPKDTAGFPKEKLERLGTLFFHSIEEFLKNTESGNCPGSGSPDVFSWEPRKGRIRYCDIVAIDLICKINQNVYPVGVRLPGSPALADIYHISEITARRTISLLNKLDITETVNGVGTFVVSRGGSEIPYKLKDLTLDDNLRVFLEALQILAVISEPVMLASFPHVPREMLEDLYSAASMPDETNSMVHTISIGLQAVVRYCPLAAIQDIYSKLTLLLLRGSILRLDKTGSEPVAGWSSISSSIRSGCVRADYNELARAFRTLFERNFTSAKKELLEIGVEGAEHISGF